MPQPDPAAGMEQLRAIQRSFATGIMRPLTGGQRMQPDWIDGRPALEAVATFIKPNDRLTSFDRLEIYNRQYWFRLLDSLYEDFPGLRTLVGEKQFYQLSVAYLTDYPSNSFTLRNLGERMERFLAEQPEWTRPHEGLGRDIVRLEWAHILAFDNETLPPLEIDALLGQGDPATLKLHLQPHITLLACDYPVDDFILAVRRRVEPRGEASNAIDERIKPKMTRKVPRPRAEKTWLAVHRSDYAVYYKRLDPGAWMLLSALQEGLPLQEACEKVASSTPTDMTFCTKLQTWFAQWATLGWFCHGE